MPIVDAIDLDDDHHMSDLPIGERTLKCDNCQVVSPTTTARGLPRGWFSLPLGGIDDEAHACSNACVQKVADLQTRRLENPSCDCEDCNGN